MFLRQLLYYYLFHIQNSMTFTDYPELIKDKNRQYYGIEYELIMKDTKSISHFVDKLSRILINIFHIDDNFIGKVKRDFSIKARKGIGIELISLPRPYSYFLTNKYKAIHKILSDNFYVNSTCGLHISIPNYKIDESLLIDRFVEIINKANEIETIKKMFNRKRFRFCNYENFIDYYEIPCESKSDAISKDEKRIEFRIFGGTLNYRKMIKFMNLIYALTKKKEFNADFYIKSLTKRKEADVYVRTM